MFIIYLLLSSGIFNTPLFTSPEETSVKSEIKEVTVFQSSARVTRRTVPHAVTKNSYIFKLENVSPYFDQNSLQVKMKGDGYISQVKHRKNHLQVDKLSEEIKEMNLLIQSKQDSISEIELVLKALAEHESFLRANSLIRSDHENLKAQNLKDITAFYSQEMKDIIFQRESNNKLIKDLKNQQSKYVAQRNEINPKMKSIPNEILVTLVSERAQNISLETTYQVRNAGWYSSYHLRATDTEAPINLVHFANVYQRTGEEWTDVKLSLTNENDRISKNAPNLTPLNIPSRSYGNKRHGSTGHFNSNHNGNQISGTVVDDTGLPLIGANVILKNTTHGTTTDIDGRFVLTIPPGSSEDIIVSYTGYTNLEVSTKGMTYVNLTLSEGQILEEIVIRGSRKNEARLGYAIQNLESAKPKPEYYDYSIPSSTVSQTQLNFSFVMDTPYSIKDDGKNNEVAIRQIELDASYKYKAVPKLSDKVYLMAYVDEWEDKNLLKGNMNLYFEGAYIGKSLLDPHQLKDSISISLGVDSNIKVERTRDEYFTKKKFMSSKKYTKLGYTINIKSAKSAAIDIEVWDQIPVSIQDDIKVNQKEISPGFILNEKTGIGNWTFKLGAKEQKELKLSFELKYPEHYHFNF